MDRGHKLLKVLADRTVEFFNNDLSMKVSENYCIEKVDELKFSDITAFIDLKGDLPGTVGMSVSADLSQKMAKSFTFGELPQDELDALASETVAEVINVTLGNILQYIQLLTHGCNIDISVPYLMTKDTQLEQKKDSFGYLCELNFEDETIILIYY